MSKPLTHTYKQLHHPDGRIENWHYAFIKDQTLPDLLHALEAIRSGIKVKDITKYQFETDYEKAFKVNIYEDRYKAGDAEGDYLGYIEHYEKFIIKLN